MKEIVIDAGHGGTGAVEGSSCLGVVGPTGLREKDVNLHVAQRLSARLGNRALLTRRNDQNLSLGQRVAIAQRAAAQAFLSIHANSGSAGQRGPEIWVHEHAGPASLGLAQRLQAGFQRLGGVPPIHRGPMAVLSPAHHARDTAACLVEVDYLSDPQVERRLRNPAALDAIAAALADGISDTGSRYGDGGSSLDERWPNRLSRWIPDATLDMKFLQFGKDLDIDAIGAIFGPDSWGGVVNYINHEEEMEKKLVEMLEALEKVPIGEEAKIFALVAGIAFLAELAPMGIGYYDAWKEIAEREGSRGFANGLMWTADGRSPSEVRDPSRRGSWWNYVQGLDATDKRISLNSHRMGLIAGMVSGQQLTVTQKENLFADLQFRDEANKRLVDWSLRDNPTRPDSFYSDAAIIFHWAHL
jgi:hypothetical protein